MISEFAQAILDYSRALRMIVHRQIIGYCLLQGILSVLIMSIWIYLVWQSSDNIAAWIIRYWPWEFARPLMTTVLEWLSVLLMIALGIMILRYLIYLCCGPFMSKLSERIEQLVNTTFIEVDMKSSRHSGWWRGLRMSIQLIMKEVVRVVGLLLIGLFPMLSFLSGPAIIVVQSYYAGVGNMDFTMERYYSRDEAFSFARKHRAYAIGNGLIFILLLMIPVLGTMCALPLSTIASTIGVNRLRSLLAEQESRH